jgi:cytochrome c oxidase subunit III
MSESQSSLAGHDPHGGGHGHGHPRLQHHFQDMRTQQHAVRLGMWLFLATEILLFGGLFCAYSAYRTLYPEAWKACSEHTDRFFGMFETFDLIFSSFTMVMAIHYVRVNKRKLAVLMLLVTMGCGLGFLVMHGFEYHHEFMEGALPGKYYHFEEVTATGAPMYYAVYFLMTGLHSIHVFIGVAVLGVITYFTNRGDYDASYDHPLDLAGLYWHLVDLIWIFLFPLLYLV